MAFKTRAFDERFFDKVSMEPMSGCWLWTGSANKVGYGYIFLRKKAVLAHRASYEMFVKKIPKKMCVLHMCDTPSCVNPNHLFLGTHFENTKDMVLKRRHGKLRNKKEQIFCINGHLFSEENSKINLNISKITGEKRSYKTCKICAKANVLKYRNKIKSLREINK